MSPTRRTLRPGTVKPMSLKGRILLVVIGVPAFLGATALINLLVIGAIWPGEAKVFEPILCSDSHPEAFVVSDTYQVSDGTSTDFTVYCVADDGDAIDVGWGRAWFLGWVLHTVLILAVLTFFVIRLNLRTLRRLRRGGAEPDRPGPPGRSATEAERHPADRTGGEPTTLEELIERDFPTSS